MLIAGTPNIKLFALLNFICPEMEGPSWGSVHFVISSLPPNSTLGQNGSSQFCQ